MKNTLRALRYSLVKSIVKSKRLFPVYYGFARIGARISRFFFDLRPSERAERRRVDHQGLGNY